MSTTALTKLRLTSEQVRAALLRNGATYSDPEKVAAQLKQAERKRASESQSRYREKKAKS